MFKSLLSISRTKGIAGYFKVNAIFPARGLESMAKYSTRVLPGYLLNETRSMAELLHPMYLGRSQNVLRDHRSCLFSDHRICRDKPRYIELGSFNPHPQ